MSEKESNIVLVDVLLERLDDLELVQVDDNLLAIATVCRDSLDGYWKKVRGTYMLRA